jgi:signal transduction histidine kinase
VDAQGRVVAASGNIQGKPRLATFPPRGREGSSRTEKGFGGGHEEFRVRAVRATSPQMGDLIVYAAVSLEPAEEITRTVRHILLIGLPPLVALVAFTTWMVVGRALRPVEAIRAQVADVSERALDRRVPVPPAEDEVARLARTMNAMLDRLQGAVAKQRRFVANASHELQSPLASLRTDLEVALAHPRATDWATTAADLLEENRRMERLVQDLLFLARADEDASRPPPTLVDLEDVVLAEAARLRSYQRIRVDTSRVAPAAVLGWREDLTRAVRNLLDNAERHAEATVTLELADDAGWATLVVADDGPGIPTAHRELVFERFARLDEDRSRARGGTGLGLAIVREIVTAHRGTVSVDGSEGSGARLVLRIPGTG